MDEIDSYKVKIVLKKSWFKLTSTKIICLILFLILLFVFGSQVHCNVFAIDNGYNHMIFTHTRVYSNSGTESDIIEANCKKIQSYPKTVKIIIAKYSTFLPDYMLVDRNNLARALGGYKSLEDAQSDLLKEWNNNFTISGVPVSLTIRETMKSIVFTYGFVYGMNYVEDEFVINAWGNISHVRQKRIESTF